VAASVYDPQARATIDNGVITAGSSVLDESMVELGFLAKASQVKPGQLVMTSGLGGIFPRGIRIGEVVDTRPVDFGLYTVARVKLTVKMNLLDQVWVMMP
jgi:rod shape-determining protein MreC